MSDTYPPLADGYHSLGPGRIAAIVTYLEMSERPDWINTAHDQALVLAHQTAPEPNRYRALFREIGTPYLWTSRLHLNDNDLQEVLTQSGRSVFEASCSGRVIGLVELMRNERSVEISFFGLKPGATGQGLGQSMMAAALELAWQGNTKRVWLHTCTFDHPAALHFYRKCGFTPVSLSVEIMEDPRLTGLLPADAAPHIPLLPG